MKRIMVLLMISLCGITSQAQVSEWFSQKQTQIKYLLQQIVLLQKHIGDVSKGYRIAKDGLHFIGDMKNGEFNLHKDYFNSLSTVNTVVKKYQKVAAIIQLETATVNYCKQAKNKLQKGNTLTVSELQYINNVFDKALDNAVNILGELVDLTTNGNLEMKDAERIERIDGLYAQMQEDYRFVNNFGTKAIFIATNRRHELQEIQRTKIFNNIK